jgi:hypothetical protein
VPDLTVLPGTCQVCGCTDQEPCLGGAVFPPSDPGPHRMVDAPELLEPGATCTWLDEDETICSAHSTEELEAAGIPETRGWPFMEANP